MRGCACARRLWCCSALRIVLFEGCLHACLPACAAACDRVLSSRLIRSHQGCSGILVVNSIAVQEPLAVATPKLMLQQRLAQVSRQPMAWMSLGDQRMRRHQLETLQPTEARRDL